jgi:hypothetical protein
MGFSLDLCPRHIVLALTSSFFLDGQLVVEAAQEQLPGIDPFGPDAPRGRRNGNLVLP